MAARRAQRPACAQRPHVPAGSRAPHAPHAHQQDGHAASPPTPPGDLRRESRQEQRPRTLLQCGARLVVTLPNGSAPSQARRGPSVSTAGEAYQSETRSAPISEAAAAGRRAAKPLPRYRLPTRFSFLWFPAAGLAGRAGLGVGGWLPFGGLQPWTDYRIGPQDLISVKVYETPELNAEELRVSAEGTISLPNAGAIVVAGRTEGEAGLEIERVLEQCCVNRASVTVKIKEYRFKPISVIGAVGRPGPVTSSGRLTLLDVLTAAGGVGSQRGDVVYVIRHGDNGLSDQLTVRLDDLLVRGEQRVNVPIFPGDLVNVPGTVEVTVFCLGEVQRPGAVTFKSSDRMTLLTTIARAGGLSDRASYKIVVKREGAGSLIEEIQVDYKAVLAGRIPDPTLKEGDVVVVKESFF